LIIAARASARTVNGGAPVLIWLRNRGCQVLTLAGRMRSRKRASARLHPDAALGRVRLEQLRDQLVLRPVGDHRVELRPDVVLGQQLAEEPQELGDRLGARAFVQGVARVRLVLAPRAEAQGGGRAASALSSAPRRGLDGREVARRRESVRRSACSLAHVTAARADRPTRRAVRAWRSPVAAAIS